MLAEMTIDDLIGNEQAFPILKHRTFLNHAAVAPITAPAAEALRRYADQAQTDVYIGTGWYRGVEACRSTVARLINATSDEVALVKNTGEGISIVARGLDWQAGARIITTAVEYPANIYPWMDLQQTHGVELVMIPETHQPDGSVLVSDDAIIAAIDHPRTRMVALSHVQYASGQRMDVARIGRRCRERGVLFCVDAIQSIGVLPVDVQSMSIDFLSADGHKWMLGPEGAGVFYIRKALLERVRPLSVGWMNVINAQDYGNYDFTLRPDARRYECGSWNIPGFLALGASLELLASVGIDVIFDRVRRLGDRLIAGLRRRGWRVISPRSEIATSAAVAFDSTRFAMQQVYESLRAQRIEVALREGRLRASPHFYNTDEQIDRLIDALPAH